MEGNSGRLEIRDAPSNDRVFHITNPIHVPFTFESKLMFKSVRVLGGGILGFLVHQKHSTPPGIQAILRLILGILLPLPPQRAGLEEGRVS